jgi:hypothetical protein
MYHVMGSILLTRSFTITAEIAQGVQIRGSGPNGVSNADATMEDGQDPQLMEVDDNEDEDEDEEEVVVLPLADMLNARYAHNNVCFPLAFRTEE